MSQPLSDPTSKASTALCQPVPLRHGLGAVHPWSCSMTALRHLRGLCGLGTAKCVREPGLVQPEGCQGWVWWRDRRFGGVSWAVSVGTGAMRRSRKQRRDSRTSRISHTAQHSPPGPAPPGSRHRGSATGTFVWPQVPLSQSQLVGDERRLFRQSPTAGATAHSQSPQSRRSASPMGF